MGTALVALSTTRERSDLRRFAARPVKPRLTGRAVEVSGMAAILKRCSNQKSEDFPVSSGLLGLPRKPEAASSPVRGKR